MAGFTWSFDEADPDAVDLLGGKGSGLARMPRGGLPVPPGYIVSTEACRQFLADGRLPGALHDEVFGRLSELERRTGKTFGAGPDPLLVSVRSGAPVSMPGMMDTVLNLGLGRDAAIAVGVAARNTRFMADLLVRFHRMYAETLLGALDPPPELDELAAAVAVGADPAATYDRVWQACEEAVLDDVGARVPAEPREQVIGAVEAVFRSWNTRRAVTYRDFHHIPHDLGTAVVVQSMVFGNLSDDSGSGVVFTRNPVTGENELFGEFLANTQGEDVVAGTRTPVSIADAATAMPEVFEELRTTCLELERQQADVLDIEFTVERSRLWFLQVRSAKRTPQAAVRIAADFLRDGVVEAGRALATVRAEQVRQVQRPGFDTGELDAARADGRLLATGIGASPGQVSGALMLDSDRAKQAAMDGAAVILARPTTSPADLHGMIASEGIVTGTGGSTSHAAVVARALGKACVVGCSAAQIDLAARTLTVADADWPRATRCRSTAPPARSSRAPSPAPHRPSRTPISASCWRWPGTPPDARCSAASRRRAKRPTPGRAARTAHSDVMWLKVRVLQAATFGIPLRQLLIQQPLDEYLRRGMLSTDPRWAIDPSVDTMLATVARSAASHPLCEVGMRLSGPTPCIGNGGPMGAVLRLAAHGTRGL